MNDNGGPAFPRNERAGDGTHWHSWEGMSMRAYFFAKAMQGLCANPNSTTEWLAQHAVWSAWNLADEMLRCLDADAPPDRPAPVGPQLFFPDQLSQPEEQR